MLTHSHIDIDFFFLPSFLFGQFVCVWAENEIGGRRRGGGVEMESNRYNCAVAIEDGAFPSASILCLTPEKKEPRVPPRPFLAAIQPHRSDSGPGRPPRGGRGLAETHTASFVEGIHRSRLTADGADKKKPSRPPPSRIVSSRHAVEDV